MATAAQHIAEDAARFAAQPAEQRVLLRGATWGDYQRLDELRGESVMLLGPLDAAPERPDIAIEVVKTSGGINKLRVYQGLGVPEVWFWQQGRLSFHLLEADGYREAGRSVRMPGLDPGLIAECMAAPSQTVAVRNGVRLEFAGRPKPAAHTAPAAPCAANS
jgi:hypothetical protein